MYKWHANSAIGRGRYVSNDLARVADGIATSLRQFSISTTRCADNNDNAPPRSQSQRSRAAAAELTSLAPPPPKGIDARALAAKPPPNFTIRRVDIDEKQAPAQPSRGGFRGSPRGAARGGLIGRGRGRGALRGRGRGRGDGASNGRSGGSSNRGHDPDFREEPDELDDDTFTPAEKAQVNAWKSGEPRAYESGETTLANLRFYAPALATTSSPMGQVEVIREQFRTLVGDRKSERVKWGKIRRIGGDMALDEKTKSAILDGYVAGLYREPADIVRGDTDSVLDNYAQRSSTYLAGDAAILKAKVQSLMPQRKAETSRKTASQ